MRSFVESFHSRSLASSSLAHASSSYTVAPVASGKVLDAPFHAHRLYKSAHLLLGLPHDIKGDEKAFPAFVEGFVEAVNSLPERDSATNGSLTICACLGSDISRRNWNLSAALFSGATGKAGADDLIVDLASSNYFRSTPAAKAASWPTERRLIEARRHPTASETILCTANNTDNNDIRLLEGLTSNLFVVKDEGTVLQTAPAGLVLEGSMASLVIKLARSLGMSVEEEAPKLASILKGEVSSAFLSSATKPIANIGTFLGSDGAILRVFSRDTNINALSACLREGLNECREFLPDRKIWWKLSSFASPSCVSEILDEVNNYYDMIHSPL